MIVKIRHDDHWWVFDNVVRIHYQMVHERITVEEFNKRTELDLCLIKDREGMVEFNRLQWRDKDGSLYQVAFEEVAYLCNDSGKTIEKIPGPRIQ